MYYLYKKAKAKKRARIAAVQEDASNPKAAQYEAHEKASGIITRDPSAEEGAEHKKELSQKTLEEGKIKKHNARVYRWKLVAGLFLPYFIASTDVTIIATALPFIASHFNQIEQLNWIVTAFTITSTSFIPVWGQLADVFGRHAVLQSVMVIMMIGAALAAGAQAWVMLLFGRALMGVAAAGMLNIIKVVLADKVSLKENATNNTVFSLVGGISFGVGPVIGGYLTASNWRWCFILNIPVAACAMIAIFVLLRHDLVGPSPCHVPGRFNRFLYKLSTVDLGGLVLFIAGTTLIILGTTWGGATYAWNSAAVITPIVLGSLCFLTFFLYEHLLSPGHLLSRYFPRQQPMIPLSLFHKKDLPLCAWISFSTGAAMYSIFYFVGIYFTLVKSYPASKSGIQLLYYLPGIGVGVYSAMFFANIWPRATWPPLFIGSVLETAGFAGLIAALRSGQVSVIAGMMALAGAGTGVRLMPETLHVSALHPQRLAAALSVIDFCVPFGGTIALAIMGAVFNNKLLVIGGGGGVAAGAGGAGGPSQSSLDAIAALPAIEQDAFRDSARHAVEMAFVAVLPVIGLAVVAALGLGNVRIRKTDGEGEAEGPGEGDGVARGEVEEEVWILRGWKRRGPR